MEYLLPTLRREEKIALHLRAMYEAQGYRLFRMGSFEEYDLYMQNRSFLVDEDIITFTSADGRLMALRPDVTLSIVKSVQPGECRKLYYTENVFRRSRQTGEYREISQMGLEYISEGLNDGLQAEVVLLAAKSLAAAGAAVLDLSHMEIIEQVLQPFAGAGLYEAALAALQSKSTHTMLQLAEEAGLMPRQGQMLAAFTGLSGPYSEVVEAACGLIGDIPGCQKPLEELERLYRRIEREGLDTQVRLDFSILNDADYYNGLIFQGYVGGAPAPVLTGGRYDNLLRRFGKKQGAVGFALNLDELSIEEQNAELVGRIVCDNDWINVALPKGRMGNKAYGFFEQAGLGCEGMREDTRKLVLEDSKTKVRYFWVKPSDVDIYVEHGAADIGVVGKDVLLESGADVLELMDLGLGACYMAVACQENFQEDPARTLRVATKYPSVTRSYYAAQSRTVEIIKLHGSIELAPILGLADVIVDIVETGKTLKENNLAVLAKIEESSARLVANKAAWRFKEPALRTLLDKLEEREL